MSKQKAPDDRTYSLVSECAKSFCTHSKKTWVCPICSYRGWLFFGSCKDFAFSLNVSGVKPAVGDGSGPITEEHELLWAAVIFFLAFEGGTLQNKQILWCSWRTVPSLRAAEGRRAWRSLPPFAMGSDLVLALRQGGCKGRVRGAPCSRLASAVPTGLSRQLLLGDGAGSGPFSEAGWRKGDYRHRQEESGVTLPTGPHRSA